MSRVRKRSGVPVDETENLSPPEEKSKKLSGAAKYRTKYRTLWKKEFPFIAAVPGDSYR